MRTLFALILALPVAAHAATAQFLKAQQLRVDASRAEDAGDLPAAEAALKEALEIRPSHPGIVLSLASVQARLGKLDEGAGNVAQFASMGLTADIKSNPDFAALKYKPYFIGALARIEKNALPVGMPVEAFRLGDGSALFEAVAIDPEMGRAFAGSVRERRIEMIENGVAKPFAGADSGLWSVFGLAIDAKRNLLWAASAAASQMKDVTPENLGAAGLFAFDLTTGKLMRKAVLPPDGKAVLGDLSVAGDGTVYVSDSTNPVIYRLAPGATTLEVFVTNERFVSLQGLTLSADGRMLAVADYALGLFAIDIASRKVASISAPSGVAMLGIDELTGTGPFIATQNGVNPQRVIEIGVDEEWGRVTSVDVLAANSPLHDDITLGQIDGDSFVYVANSQWNRFDKDGSILNQGQPFAETVAVRIPLPK